jgi:hypothetical protein
MPARVRRPKRDDHHRTAADDAPKESARAASNTSMQWKQSVRCLAISVAVLGLSNVVPSYAQRAPTAGRRPSAVAVAGRWSGEGWGDVAVRPDGSGSYTDTYGTGPGRLKIRPVGDGHYTGEWSESSLRFGTLELYVARDGRTASGVWTPDVHCALGTMNGGTVAWSRR